MNEAHEEENQAAREATAEERAERAATSQALQAAAAQLAEREADLQALRARHERAMLAKDTTIRALEIKLAAREQAVAALTSALRDEEARQRKLEQTMGWQVLRKLQTLRAFVAPPGSSREHVIERTIRRWQQARQGRTSAVRPVDGSPSRSSVLQIEPMRERPAPLARQVAVDIVICVHDALADVQRCLASVRRSTEPPYSLILVDDGSAGETRDFLAAWCPAHGARLLRNEQAVGYTRAANQGMRAACADFVVLLNSDTVVTDGWLDRLVACAASDPSIGLAGPLSNTASWQSIPELFGENGDWAANAPPAGRSIDDVAAQVTQHSGQLYPRVPLLNGFCLLVRRQVIEQVGCFDEESFGAGYGEENDYGLRARAAGWQLALADDAYVYHAQGRSYTDERRRQLSERANQALAAKHGQLIINQSCDTWREDRVIQGIRARSRVMWERQACLDEGRKSFAGRRLLFVLPVAEPGGGTNIIINEALAMCRMGVDVRLFNVDDFRPLFTRAYPDLALPVIFGTRDALPELAGQFDAVIATVNHTVEWLAGIKQDRGRPVRGYYVQDFEPMFYEPGTADYRRAWESYTLFPDLVRFTQTSWNQSEVARQIGVDCARLGPLLDIDLFRPRPRSGPELPGRPLRIAAMVRPSTPRRAPRLTMSVLRSIARRYGDGVEVRIFGVVADDRALASLPIDFPWRCAGILRQEQVVTFINEVDVFVDFSLHQALGMTALEAMASGVAVVAPRRGGSGEFAQDGVNALLVDSSSEEACTRSVMRLVEEQELRGRLQQQAIFDACACFHERPALNILKALFGPKGDGAG